MYISRLAHSLLLANCLIATVVAQANTNLVERNNKTALIGATTVHTPTEYFLAGITADTDTWRHIPSLVNDRRTIGFPSEARRCSGFTIMLEPTGYQPPIQGGYAPEMEIRRARFQATGWVPDYFTPALITLPKANIVFRSAGRLLLNRSLFTAVGFTEREVCITAKWEGGERLGRKGQVITGSHYEKTFLHPSPLTPSSTIGSRLPGQAPRQNTATNELSRPYMSYISDLPVANVQATWANLFGNRDYGIGLGTSQLNTTAGSARFEIAGGARNAGLLAVPLFNFGLVQPVAKSVIGQVVEVNVGDPVLGAFGPLVLDGAGNGVLPVLNVPVLPGTIGLALGIEFMVFDAVAQVATGSTQAVWMKISQ